MTTTDEEIEQAAKLGYETSVLHWVGESEYDEDGEHSWEGQTDGLKETWRAIARNALAFTTADRDRLLAAANHFRHCPHCAEADPEQCGGGREALAALDGR